MTIPDNTRAQLALLREEAAHSSGFQDWVAAWWAKLAVDERRLLLLISGLDATEAAARRQWRQLVQEHRDTLLTQCKRVARLIDGLKWA